MTEPVYMLYNCQKSCHVCIDEKEYIEELEDYEECEDYKDECSEWAFQGEVKTLECSTLLL